MPEKHVRVKSLVSIQLKISIEKNYGIQVGFIVSELKRADKAANAGAGLMLSVHTHGGQIWPFGYLVRQRYPLLEGRYEVDGMSIMGIFAQRLEKVK